MNETVNQLNNMEKQKSSIDYGKLLQDLLKHKKLFYKVFAITFVVACVYALSLPSYYKCKVTLSPEMSTTRSSSSLASLASSFGVNLKGMSNNSEALFPTLYPDLMNSTNFLTGLFEIPVTIEGNKKKGEPDRTMTYYEYLTNEQKKTWWSAAIGGATTWFFSLFTDSVPEPDKVDPFRLTKKQAAVIKAIDKKIVCEVDKKTMVISIEVTDQNPVICATMADSVKLRLQKAITDYRTSKARVDLEYNKKVYAEAQDRLRQVSEEYARFADGNQKAFLQSVRQKESELEDKLTVQRGICRQLASQVQQAEMRVQEATPAFTTLQNATVPVKRDGPVRKKILLVFLFLAFLATSAWCLHKEGDLKPLLGLSSN
jgi:uncharacterized protein involved in exopolysaccharide biosynthesis